MNEARRSLLKILAFFPWLSFLGGRKIPEYVYEWNGSGQSTDPRMPILGYGDSAPFIYLNGKLVSHKITGELTVPGIYTTRCQSGIRGWVEHSIRDKDNNPTFKEVVKTEEQLRADGYSESGISRLRRTHYPSTTAHNGVFNTYTVEEIAVEKIYGVVEVVPRIRTPEVTG